MRSLLPVNIKLQSHRNTYIILCIRLSVTRFLRWQKKINRKAFIDRHTYTYTHILPHHWEADTKQTQEGEIMNRVFYFLPTSHYLLLENVCNFNANQLIVITIITIRKCNNGIKLRHHHTRRNQAAYVYVCYVSETKTEQ